jgi:hypothetical protein
LQLRGQSIADCDPVAKLGFARHTSDVICDIGANSQDCDQSRPAVRDSGYPDNQGHSAICSAATAFYAGVGNRVLSNRIDEGFVVEAEIAGRRQGIVCSP